MNEYTPTTEDVRASAESDNPYGCMEEGAFDRWIRAHDAEVAAKTLEDAARVWDKEGGRIGTAISVITWLRARAKRIQGTK